MNFGRGAMAFLHETLLNETDNSLETILANGGSVFVEATVTGDCNCNFVIVIAVYSPSCLGQETAKGPFGLRVTLLPAYLSTTHGRDFTLFLLMLNVKQESCEY